MCYDSLLYCIVLRVVDVTQGGSSSLEDYVGDFENQAEHDPNISMFPIPYSSAARPAHSARLAVCCSVYIEVAIECNGG